MMELGAREVHSEMGIPAPGSFPSRNARARWAVSGSFPSRNALLVRFGMGVCFRIIPISKMHKMCILSDIRALVGFPEPYLGFLF